ncbi:Wadjet anti-phage system protein JetD domain-containing protein [Novipirellula sp.]|uniref:Wadjet anti-phage system protein JetD domain-containing protein n=1 Tax=Novipirellula sp. TaxID=2795430 RepID=UPI0035639CBD
MIAPETITQKARRLFPKAVDAWIAGELESFFPYRMPADLKVPTNHADAIRQVEMLRQSAKQTRGFGYRVVWQSRRSRTHGLNDFPTAIEIESMEDLARLSDRSEDWSRLQVAVNKLRDRQPTLERWLARRSNWKTLLDVSNSLDGLLDVIDYFQNNPRPDCFARELPLAVSTKLIESNRRRLAAWLDIVLPPSAIDPRYGYDEFEPRYGLRYARPHFLVRVLDEQLQHDLGLPFAEISLPAESLASLQVNHARVIIVENKINLLTLPKLTRTIALGGLGNAVTQLCDVSWLQTSDVHYWGDLDADGFAILDRLRQRLPKVQSLLMTAEVFESLSEIVTAGNGVSVRELHHLTMTETALYQRLCQSNQRLEQEHIPQTVVQKAFEHWGVSERTETNR